jgi:Mg-chelatase subunit ChlD
MTEAFNKGSELQQTTSDRHTVFLLLTDGYAEDKADAINAAKRLGAVKKSAKKDIFFISMGIGKDHDKSLLNDLSYQANGEIPLLKIGDSKICELVISDSDFSKDWVEIFNSLSDIVEKKEIALISKIN